MPRDPDGLKVASKWADGQVADRADPPDALRASGFPESYGPGGTDTVMRLRINQILAELSGHGVEFNTAGFMDWDAGRNYPANAHTWGGRQLWRATVATGPDHSNATDPSAAGQVIWVPFTADSTGDQVPDLDIDIFKLSKWAAEGEMNRAELGNLRISGWPATYSPVDGETPRRLRLNQIFAELSALGMDVRDYGGILPWSAEANYRASAGCSRGSLLYESAVATGPNSGNVTDPLTPGQAVWVRIIGRISEPAAPVMRATAGVNQVIAEWDAPDDNGDSITGYRLQWKSGVQAYSVVLQRMTSSLSQTISGLANGTVYTFRVFATNGQGEGPASAEVTAAPRAEVPGIPRNVTATARSRGALVGWGEPPANGSTIIGYRVQWRKDNEAFSTINEQAVTGTSVTITGLDNGDTYFFRVVATNAIGDGAWSDGLASTVPFASPPGRTVSPRASQRDGALATSWTAPNDGGSDITEYLLEWRKSTEAYSPATQQVVSGTSFRVGSLENGTEYTLRVSARNIEGYGPVSVEFTGTPQPASIHLNGRSQAWGWVWSEISEGTARYAGR